MNGYPNVFIFDHPLIRHKVSILRDEKTGVLRASGRSGHCFIDGKGIPLSFRRRFPAWDSLFRQYAENSAPRSSAA